MRIYELTPGGYDRAKSFYGKAKVIEKDGGAKQVGHVITGKTEFDKGDYTGYSTQYIDLWVTVLTVVDTVF